MDFNNMQKKVVKQKTIVEQVLADFKELIANGTFPVGEKIPKEANLAETFGIGRSSIREVLKILQYLGIVELKPGKGTFVCDNTNLSKEVISWSILLGQKDFFELFDLRRAIETIAVEDFILMKKMTSEQWDNNIGSLESCFLKMKNAESDSTFINEDYSFHETIIEGCGNSVYLDIYHTLRTFMHEEINRSFHSALRDHLDKVHSEHESILNSIKNRDLKKALKSLNTHLQNIKQRLEESFQNGKSNTYY
jgi:GntR family transcriptional regulator, transcriptional repressor for pyruvate dehydrogenase complex